MKYMFPLLLFTCSSLSAAEDYYAVAVAEVQYSKFHSQIDPVPNRVFIGVNINLRVKNIQKIGGGNIPRVFSGITTAHDPLRKGVKIIVRYRFHKGKLQYDSWSYPSEFSCFSSNILEGVESNFDIYFEAEAPGGKVTCLSRKDLTQKR